VPAEPLPPVALAVSFVDAVNRADVDALSALMTDDHRLVVFDEPPLVGRDANVDAWRGYVDSYPTYVIHPRQLAEVDGRVAVLGHTTGSHLGLPADVEVHQTLIWVVEVAGGLVREWRLVEDDPIARTRLGLT
jgi:ketosteroid isomerase-like protein